jgi:hypothetical protein
MLEIISGEEADSNLIEYSSKIIQTKQLNE